MFDDINRIATAAPTDVERSSGEESATGVMTLAVSYLSLLVQLHASISHEI